LFDHLVPWTILQGHLLVFQEVNVSGYILCNF